MKPVLSGAEAKLLFTLLDAAADEGRLRDTPFAERWQKTQETADPFPKLDRGALFLLVQEIDAAGLIEHSWMKERWLLVKRRVENEPVKFPASQAPFS